MTYLKEENFTINNSTDTLFIKTINSNMNMFYNYVHKFDNSTSDGMRKIYQRRIDLYRELYRQSITLAMFADIVPMKKYESYIELLDDEYNRVCYHDGVRFTNIWYL